MKIIIENSKNTFINNNKKYNIINIILEDLNEKENDKIQEIGLYNFFKLICKGFNIIISDLKDININDIDITIYDNRNIKYLEYIIYPQNILIDFEEEFDNLNEINFNSRYINNIKHINFNVYLTYPIITYSIYDKYIYIKYFFNDLFDIYFNELTILNYNEYNDFYIYLLEEIYDNIKNSTNRNNYDLSMPIKIKKNNHIIKLLEENNTNCSFSY